MATTTPARSATADGDQCVEMHGLDWKGYLTMLRLRGERPSPRMVYLDGNLWLMSPSFPHERLAERLGIFVIELVVGLEIPCIMAGSTTFRRRKRRGGSEPDKSFYLAHEALVRGKDKIDLRVDPPPDLAIEAAHTRGASAAVEVYRRFRVPEVWVGDEEGIRILILQANDRYARADASAAFPFLTAAEISHRANRPQTVSDTEWANELRRWVREVLAPRRR